MEDSGLECRDEAVAIECDIYGDQRVELPEGAHGVMCCYGYEGSWERCDPTSVIEIDGVTYGMCNPSGCGNGDYPMPEEIRYTVEVCE